MNNSINISQILQKPKLFAIIGASNNPEKFGYKIYKQLKELGFTVYAINNKEELIQGDKAYKSVSELGTIDITLNFVVPPEISLMITKEAYDKGFRTFWYQPGSFDDKILAFHKDKDTIVISDQCLLIESGKLK